MAVLSNGKHEQFAQAVARAISATKAYVSAGYSDKGAKQSASRMLTHAVLCFRIRELQETLAAGTIALEISSRNARVQAPQDRWSMLRCALALPVYKVDTGLSVTEGEPIKRYRQWNVGAGKG